MTPKNGAPSFLAPIEQPTLALNVEGQALQTLEAAGDYTAERLFLQRPQVYRLVVQLLGRGWGSQKIADTVRQSGESLSKNTVKAVRAREGETIDLVRARLSGAAFDLAAGAFESAGIIVDEIMDDPARRKKLTVKDASALAIIGGIATQNAQLLSGAATARVEVREIAAPDHDAFNKYLENLPTVETTHLSEGISAQKGGANRAENAATDGAPGVDTSGAATKTIADIESED